VRGGQKSRINRQGVHLPTPWTPKVRALSLKTPGNEREAISSLVVHSRRARPAISSSPPPINAKAPERRSTRVREQVAALFLRVSASPRLCVCLLFPLPPINAEAQRRGVGRRCSLPRRSRRSPRDPLLAPPTGPAPPVMPLGEAPTGRPSRISSLAPPRHVQRRQRRARRPPPPKTAHAPSSSAPPTTQPVRGQPAPGTAHRRARPARVVGPPPANPARSTGERGLRPVARTFAYSGTQNADESPRSLRPLPRWRFGLSPKVEARIARAGFLTRASSCTAQCPQPGVAGGVRPMKGPLATGVKSASRLDQTSEKQRC